MAMRNLTRNSLTMATQRLTVLGHPGWLALLAVLCGTGLLLAFQQVVSQGVQQSRSRHQATAARTEATWRCNLLNTASERAACLAQLDRAP